MRILKLFIEFIDFFVDGQYSGRVVEYFDVCFCGRCAFFDGDFLTAFRDSHQTFQIAFNGGFKRANHIVITCAVNVGNDFIYNGKNLFCFCTSGST